MTPEAQLHQTRQAAKSGRLVPVDPLSVVQRFWWAGGKVSPG